jgi:hypothetical protein
LAAGAATARTRAGRDAVAVVNVAVAVVAVNAAAGRIASSSCCCCGSFSPVILALIIIVDGHLRYKEAGKSLDNDGMDRGAG